MFFLLSYIYLGSFPSFKYKVITASVPGQPGTIEYIEITMGEHIVRFDHGPDLTRLFDKQNESEIYLDHRHKTWRKVPSEKEDPIDILFRFQSEAAPQCQGQVFRSNVIDENFNLYLIIEFIAGPNQNQLMSHLLDLQNKSSFDLEPKGSIPCYIQVMAEEPVLTITLVEQSTEEADQSYFEVPVQYEELNP